MNAADITNTVKKFLGLTLFASCLFSNPGLASQLDYIVAEVNGDIITASELAKETNSFIQQLESKYPQIPPRHVLENQILDKLIVEIIQKQYAEQMGIYVDDITLDMELKHIAERNNMDIEALKTKLEETADLSFEDYRESLRSEIARARLQQRELAQQMNVTSEDVDSYLQSPEAQDQSGVEYQLGHILLSLPEAPSPEEVAAAEKEANDLLNQLVDDGADFQQLALMRSKGQHALSGGVLSWRKMGEIPTLFIKDATNMTINEVRGPLRSPSGFHIIKMIDKRKPEQTAFTQSRVRQILIKTGSSLSVQEAKSKIYEIRHAIAEGQSSFEEMAEKFSQEANSSIKGGDLGWLSKEQVIPEFYDAIKEQSIGELGQPFKTSFGWHLVEVIDRRTEDNSQEMLRQKALLVLQNRKREEALSHWLREIRDSASVEIYLEQAKS